MTGISKTLVNETSVRGSENDLTDDTSDQDVHLFITELVPKSPVQKIMRFS